MHSKSDTIVLKSRMDFNRRLWSHYEFVYGHFISGVHEVLEDGQPFSYFTILRCLLSQLFICSMSHKRFDNTIRDPIDRIASLYEFWKQIGHGEKDLKEKSLKVCCFKLNTRCSDPHTTARIL